MKYFITTFLLCIGTNTFAQELHPEIMMQPGRTIESNQPKSYADSVQFDSLFKVFYEKNKPALSVHEQAQVQFSAISRTFKMQGIDSAEAAKAAFRNLDPHLAG